MNRLTDDNTAEKLREVSDKLKAGGFEVDISNERYIKLAEYEQTGLTPEQTSRLINPDTLWREIVSNVCMACEYHSFKHCKCKDKCKVSEILARIDGARWLEEAGCWK